MSATVIVSEPIRLASGPLDTLRAVHSPAEDKVVLLVRVGGVSTALELDTVGARHLRAALPKPSGS
jgi:hypothetical protein